MSYAVGAVGSVGNIQAGEKDYLMVPAKHIGRADLPVILWPGANTPTHWYGGPAWPANNQMAWHIARAGFVCITGDMGLETWGNAAAMARAASAHAYAAAATGANPSRAIHVGASMGAYCAIQYGIQQTAKVAGIVGMIPLCDLPGLYAAQPSFQTEIETAWGFSHGSALPGGTDAIGLAPATIKAAKMPGLLMNSSVDALVTPSSVLAMAAATGWTAGVVDHTSGHANGTIAAINLSSLVSFLKSLN